MTTPRRRTVSTELAALAMGVSEATIRKWASRGKITRYGSKQRAEYDLDELFALSGCGGPLPADGPQAERAYGLQGSSVGDRPHHASDLR